MDEQDPDRTLLLTESQRTRLEQIGQEFGALLCAADAARMNQAVMDMLRVIVLKGGMPIDQAIQLLATTMALTREKISGPSPRH